MVPTGLNGCGPQSLLILKRFISAKKHKKDDLDDVKEFQLASLPNFTIYALIVTLLNKWHNLVVLEMSFNESVTTGATNGRQRYDPAK